MKISYLLMQSIMSPNPCKIVLELTRTSREFATIITCIHNTCKQLTDKKNPLISEHHGTRGSLNVRICETIAIAHCDKGGHIKCLKVYFSHFRLRGLNPSTEIIIIYLSVTIICGYICSNFGSFCNLRVLILADFVTL